MIQNRSKKIRSIIIAYLILIISFIFFVLPLIWIIYCSFRTQASIFTGKIFSPLNEFTLENYKLVLFVTDFITYFINSFKISGLVTIVCIFLSILGAYGLSRFRIRGKNIIIIGIFSTQMFPYVLIIIPLFLVIFSFGLLDKVIGIVFAQMILVLPFCMWMLKGYFDNISEDIDDSGKIDGCNIFQRLLYIIIPMALPGILVACFYSFVVSWGDYLIVSIINQTQRTATVTLVLQRLSASLNIRWGEVAAAVSLVIVPTIILFSIVQKGLVEGLTAGGSREE